MIVEPIGVEAEPIVEMILLEFLFCLGLGLGMVDFPSRLVPVFYDNWKRYVFAAIGETLRTSTRGYVCVELPSVGHNGLKGAIRFSYREDKEGNLLLRESSAETQPVVSPPRARAP